MTNKKVVVDAHVEIDINMPWVSKRDMGYYIKRLTQEADSVKEFIRDHKSMDVNDVYVVLEYAYECEHCHNQFITDVEHLECCEKAIREWATQEELVDMGFEEGVLHE